MSKILKVNEMDDFTKEIAKDLFNRLPKSNFSEEDFLNYMKEKGSSDSISKEVLSHLKSMRFPFTSKRVFLYDNEDDEDSKEYSSNPSDWYFEVYNYEDRLFVCLSMEPDHLDDDLGSHNLPIAIKKAMNECWINTVCESEESIWEVNVSLLSILKKEDVIKAMIAKGFKHCPELMD